MDAAPTVATAARLLYQAYQETQPHEALLLPPLQGRAAAGATRRCGGRLPGATSRANCRQLQAHPILLRQHLLLRVHAPLLLAFQHRCGAQTLTSQRNQRPCGRGPESRACARPLNDVYCHQLRVLRNGYHSEKGVISMGGWGQHTTVIDPNLMSAFQTKSLIH